MNNIDNKINNKEYEILSINNIINDIKLTKDYIYNQMNNHKIKKNNTNRNVCKIFVCCSLLLLFISQIFPVILNIINIILILSFTTSSFITILNFYEYNIVVNKYKTKLNNLDYTIHEYKKELIKKENELSNLINIKNNHNRNNYIYNDKNFDNNKYYDNMVLRKRK